MEIKTFINIKDYDKDGKLFNEEEHECHSFVIAFIDLLNVQFTQASESIKDTGNTSRTISAYAANFAVDAAAADATKGIVVGTGTNAVAMTDYALQTLIAHGNGANQLSYGAMTFDPTSTTSGSDRYFQIYRTFTNNSGGNITITEVGLYAVMYVYKGMLERTLLTHTINNGASATFTYKIKITV